MIISDRILYIILVSWMFLPRENDIDRIDNISYVSKFCQNVVISNGKDRVYL